jgi:hypothetical protein
MNARKLALEAHRALLNGSGRLDYFEQRSITREIVQRAYIGFEAGAFTYPCIGKSGGLLAIHCKSEARDGNGKRRQWWKGYASDLPAKGHGRRPNDPAKVIPFGMETLKSVEPGSLVVLCCGEEDALSLRTVATPPSLSRERGFWSQSTPVSSWSLKSWLSTMPERSRRLARMA